MFETPNPQSLISGIINFYCDPTHVRPVFPETLKFLVERTGFAQVEIDYLSPVPEGVRVPETPPIDGPNREVFETIFEGLGRLDRIVFGYREFAVTGIRTEGRVER